MNCKPTSRLYTEYLLTLLSVVLWTIKQRYKLTRNICTFLSSLYSGNNPSTIEKVFCVTGPRDLFCSNCVHERAADATSRVSPLGCERYFYSSSRFLSLGFKSHFLPVSQDPHTQLGDSEGADGSQPTSSSETRQFTPRSTLSASIICAPQIVHAWTAAAG